MIICDCMQTSLRVYSVYVLCVEKHACDVQNWHAYIVGVYACVYVCVCVCV